MACGVCDVDAGFDVALVEQVLLEAYLMEVEDTLVKVQAQWDALELLERSAGGFTSTDGAYLYSLSHVCIALQ